MSPPDRQVHPEIPPARFLLISDLDGTLIPPEHRADLAGMHREFERLIQDRGDLALAYATGRSYRLAIEGIREHRLPLPDSLVCDVGSTIYHRNREAYEMDRNYRRLMQSQFPAGLDAEIRALVGGIAGVRLQEEDKQGRFKVSFYAEGKVPKEDLLLEIGKEMGSLREQVHIVFSVDPVDRSGLLDVMPRGVSKARAADYLRERLALEPERVFYAGDSGNDTEAFLAGFNAILVGNAPDSLRRHLSEEFERRDQTGRLHCAESSYVAGVLEGCERFGLSR